MIKYIILLAISFSIGAESLWKTVPEKKINSVLAEIKFDKLHKISENKMKFNKEISLNYKACSEDFPELPGQFPCNFLSDEYSSNEDEGDPSTGNLGGGVLNARISGRDSSLGGKVFILGEEIEKGKNINEDIIKIYYNKNKYISHYTYRNYFVYFDWKGSEGKETLVKIYSIELNSKKKPKKINRVIFK